MTSKFIITKFEVFNCNSQLINKSLVRLRDGKTEQYLKVSDFTTVHYNS